jgi:hypothetical protein
MRVLKTVTCAVLVLGIGGCATQRTARYDSSFPGPGSQYTLAGTPKNEVLTHLGPPTSVTTGPAGQEVLHYRVTGTQQVKYLFGVPKDQERRTVEDVDLTLVNGTVIAGTWKDAEGHTNRW